MPPCSFALVHETPQTSALSESAGLEDGLNTWTTLESREIYSNPWINLREDRVLRPDGQPGIYGVVRFANKAIGVVALNNEGKIALVGQWRYPLGAYSWEIPEGGGPLEQDPLDAAQRELAEETGLVAVEWNLLLRMHLSNSVTDEEALIYLATGLTQGQATPDGSEDLQVSWVSLQEAWSLVQEGRISDAISVAAIQAMIIRHLTQP